MKITKNGFTLIEVLIAMSIMIVVFVVSGIILIQTIRNSDITLNKLLATRELIEVEDKLRRVLSRMGPRLDEVSVTSTTVNFKVRVPFVGESFSSEMAERVAFYPNGTLIHEQVNGSSVTPLATIAQELEEVTFSTPTHGIVNYTIVKTSGTLRLSFTGAVTSPNMR
ncbi:MAG TPA: hypothetical protein DHV12_08400 [Thermotogae bacterium]|nr:hypothetical protein [Thermotogota bacterium]HCZ07127.1 hypothetical protein [Thermotogota bacterium]